MRGGCFGETRLFGGFGVERFDEVKAAQVVLQARAHSAKLLASLPVECFDLHVEGSHHEIDDGERNDGEHPHLPVDVEHRGQRADEADQLAEGADHARYHRALHRIDVGDDARHEIAAAMTVHVAERLSVELGVDAVT